MSSNTFNALQVLERNIDALKQQVGKFYQTRQNTQSGLNAHLAANPRSSILMPPLSGWVGEGQRLANLQNNLRNQSQCLKNEYEAVLRGTRNNGSLR